MTVSHSLATSYVHASLKGDTYYFRHRGSNAIGAGEWSDPISFISAGVPSAPAGLQLVDSNSTVLSLKWNATSDDGGAAVTSYQLYRDEGTLNSNFTLI